MIPNQQVTTSEWLSLPMEVRHRLITLFNIPRSEGTQVIDNRVTSDGHNHRDLSVITMEKMKEYTGSKGDDFFKVFSETIEKVGDEIYKIPVGNAPTAPAPDIIKVSIEIDGKKMEHLAINHSTEPIKVMKKGGRPKGSKNKKK